MVNFNKVFFKIIKKLSEKKRNLIPISLFMNLEVVKYLQGMAIAKDKH